MKTLLYILSLFALPEHGQTEYEQAIMHCATYPTECEDR